MAPQGFPGTTRLPHVMACLAVLALAACGGGEKETPGSSAAPAFTGAWSGSYAISGATNVKNCDTSETVTQIDSDKIQLTNFFSSPDIFYPGCALVFSVSGDTATFVSSSPLCQMPVPGKSCYAAFNAGTIKLVDGKLTASLSGLAMTNTDSPSAFNITATFSSGANTCTATPQPPGG